MPYFVYILPYNQKLPQVRPVATGRTCGKVEVDKCTHGPSLPALPPFGRQGLWLRHNKLREGTEKCNDEVRVTLIHLFSEILKKEKTIAKLICYGFNSISKRLVA